MERLTWRALLNPEYIMTFVEGFLIGFMPTAGFGHAAASNGGGTMQTLTTMPTKVVLIAAAGFGLMSGIRSLRNLRSPAPLMPAKVDGVAVAMPGDKS